MPYPSLDQFADELSDLKPLNPVAQRIIALAEDERFFAHELAADIASDPALTARMLKLANSAYYGFPRRISTVRDAVVLLGLRTDPLDVDQLPNPRSLAASVVRARLYCRAHGLSDGADPARRNEPPVEWAHPPLSQTLRRTGGMEGVRKRAEAFLDQTVH